APSENCVPLVLAETSPHAEGFACGERPFPAKLKHGATRAILLRGLRTAATRSSALTFRVKKQVGVGLAARPLVLPLPLRLGRSGQLGNGVHESPRVFGVRTGRCGRVFPP